MPQKTVYICENCQYESARWQGRCPSCEQWNTFEAAVRDAKKASGKGLSAGSVSRPVQLSEIKNTKFERISTGLGEVDSVLGGGLVPGSVILLGGDPGIGKSTIALQLANLLQSKKQKVLYVSGEESIEQLKMRNERLGLKQDIAVLSETNYEAVEQVVRTTEPDVLIIDSIQTMSSGEAGGVIGGVAQLSFVTNSLVRLAKSTNTSTFVIGHVTKEGMLAGPKTIEHMVDVVLYLEGERLGDLRLLRSNKNRFGSVGEVGVFQMTEFGLEEISNPAAMFLEHKDKAIPGSSVTAVLEGNKVLLVEVQALTNTSNLNYPRRVASGFDVNRLQLLIAIMQKTLGINLNNQDVFVNVAGGFKISERAADLPVVMAILSSYHGKAYPKGTIAFGEVGLQGEVRQVSQIEKRLKEAKKLGFTKQVTAKNIKSIELK